MLEIVQRLRRPVTSPGFDHRLGVIACYAMSALFMMMGIRKIGRLGLTEAELFFGLLLVLMLSLSGIAIGLLLALHRKLDMLQETGILNDTAEP